MQSGHTNKYEVQLLLWGLHRNERRSLRLLERHHWQGMTLHPIATALYRQCKAEKTKHSCAADMSNGDVDVVAQSCPLGQRRGRSGRRCHGGIRYSGGDDSAGGRCRTSGSDGRYCTH